MQSIRNFRDLGNIQGEYGTIIPKKILRGGPLYNINGEDLVNLTNHHHLRTIIDFRNQHERNFEPNTTLDKVQTLNLLVMEDQDETESKKETTTNSNFMYDIYETFVLSPRAQETYKTFIETVAQRVNKGSIYFHCTAGKDRTGFAAAILLKILGISDEDIYKDFLTTNDNIQKDKDSLLESIQRFHPFDDSDETLLYDVLGVKKAYLDASFETIKIHYGSFDHYIKEGLNISDETIETLRNNLLE